MLHKGGQTSVAVCFCREWHFCNSVMSGCYPVQTVPCLRPDTRKALKLQNLSPDVMLHAAHSPISSPLKP